MFNAHNLIAAITVSAAAFIGIDVSFAQSSDAEASSDVLEAIVVTAQRRAENSQDVPISVTALTASALESAGVGSTSELLNVVPGFVMSRQVKGAVPFIRGVGTADSTTGNEAGVALYVDGVYYMDPTANIFSFNNIRSIEVLKGPQGTLFGRNATGGLIQVFTRDPQTRPELLASISYGNYETIEGSLYATGGAGDIAADIAIHVADQEDGFGRQLLTGEPVNKRDERSARSKILWTPTDNDSFTLGFDWASNKSDFGMVRNVLPGSFLFGATPFRGSVYDSSGGFSPYVSDADAWGANARYEHTFDRATLSVLTAYRKNDIQYNYDQDLVALRLADVAATNETETFQAEVLLVGSTDRLNWTTGLFFFDASAAFNPLSIRSISPAANYDLYSESGLESYAAFAQGTYSLTEVTRVTVGLRYTTDERDEKGARYGATGSAAPGAITQSRVNDVSHSEPTWRLALEHNFLEDVLGYVSYSRGFKSGLFNLTDLAAEPIEPEILDAYEVGLKTEFLNSSLRFNVAAFHYIFEDIQLSRNLLGVNQLLNAAEGEINGVEIEVAAAIPVPGYLQINAGLSVLDTEYTSFMDGPVTSPNPAGGNFTAAGDLSGNDMIRSPKSTANLTADYTFDVGSGEIGLNLSYYYNDGFAWDTDNRVRQEPYSLISSQVSYTFGLDSRYRVRVFGKNLTDEVYYSYVSSNPLGDLAQAAPPRTYGIAFDLRL